MSTHAPTHLKVVTPELTVENFYETYFDFVGETEAPRIFHRWCAVSGIAALLSRQCHLPFGHWILYPNLYVMLMGSPGSRKSTSISIAKDCLERQGFSRFSADRTSKERFLMDMCLGFSSDDETDEEFLELPLDIVASRFIVADEFTDFVGKNNIEFVTMLGKLWDNPKQYEHPKIHGRSIVVPQPTVNILSGNTAQGFLLALPPEAIGQGFMSRLILVHGETTGVKITIPKEPNETLRGLLDARIAQIADTVRGKITISPEAHTAFDRIYKEFVDLDDYRFKHYSTRRFTHLLKLSLCFAALRCAKEISQIDAIQANTLLHYTELRMSKALGEYGKAKNSDVANSILEIIKHSKTPVVAKRLWKHVAQDLNKQEELLEILKGLLAAGKIRNLPDGQGFVPHHETSVRWDQTLLDPTFLTEEEMA